MTDIRNSLVWVMRPPDLPATTAIDAYLADDFEGGGTEIQNAIEDLNKVRKKKSKARKLVKILQSSAA